MAALKTKKERKKGRKEENELTNKKRKERNARNNLTLSLVKLGGRPTPYSGKLNVMVGATERILAQRTFASDTRRRHNFIVIRHALPI